MREFESVEAYALAVHRMTRACLHAGHLEHRGKIVRADNRHRTGAAGFRHAGPFDDERHPHAALVGGAFAGA